MHVYRVGQNHFCTYSAHTVCLAGKSPNIRSYTVYIYGSGHPIYTVHIYNVLANPIYTLHIYNVLANPIYTVHIYNVLANPIYIRCIYTMFWPTLPVYKNHVILTSLRMDYVSQNMAQAHEKAVGQQHYGTWMVLGESEHAHVW